MPKENSSNKILTIILAAVIIVAAIVVIYANLPKEGINTKNDNENNQNQSEEPEILLSVIYGDEKNEYSIDQIERFVPTTGYGAKRNERLFIKSPGNYTGVLITKFVKEFSEDIINYSIIIIANESGIYKNLTLNYSTIQGLVPTYNSTNASDYLGYNHMNIIIAYKKEGEYLDPSDDGNLMIGFVSEEKYATPASFWWKFVETLEIIVK